MAKQKDPHKGVQFNFRIPDAATRERWRAAAKADGRTLSGWLCALANANSLPIRKKSTREA